MNAQNIKSTTVGTNAHRRGFTLVELLLVLTILAILAGLVIPRLSNQTEHARKVAAQTEVATIGSAISQFEIDSGSFPTKAQGLQVLMTKPHDNKNTWRGPYLQKNKLPLDPWKQPYVYEFPGKHNPAFFDLYSLGKDGQGGTNTIGNWDDD